MDRNPTDEELEQAEDEIRSTLTNGDSVEFDGVELGPTDILDRMLNALTVTDYREADAAFYSILTGVIKLHIERIRDLATLNENAIQYLADNWADEYARHKIAEAQEENAMHEEMLSRDA